jgi:hypothetical protein
MAAANGIKIPNALSHIVANDLCRNDATPTEIHGSPADVPSSSSMPPYGFEKSGWTIGGAATISTSTST